MTTVFQPPPTWAMPVTIDPVLQAGAFNPIWLNWFILVAARLAGEPPLSTTVTLAALTPGGATGTMTFVNGFLTAHTPAT